MNITLYNCTAENNMLDKTSMMSVVASYSGAVARSNVSIMHPVLILQESISNIKSANYCYIEDFGRYYYIKEKSCDANGLYTLVLAVDVLMSFKSAILANKGIVSKNTYLYNMYLPGDIKSETRPLITTVQFAPTADSKGYFTNQNGQYILLGIGGK